MYRRPAFIATLAFLVLLTVWLTWRFRAELFLTREDRYQLAYQEGRLDDALQIALDLAAEDPTSARAQLGVAAVYIQRALNRQDVAASIAAAREAALKASELDPRDPDAWRAIGYTYELEGDLSAAADHYRRALKESPKDAESLTQLGFVYAARGDLERAERQFTLAVQADSYDPQARLLLAQTRLALGESDFATIEALIEPVLGSGAPLLVADAKSTLSAIRLSQGKFESAETLAREAVGDAPNSVSAMLALGEVLYDGIFSQELPWAETTAEARQLAERVLAVDPTRAAGAYLAFRVSFLVGDTAAADRFAAQTLLLLPVDRTLSNAQRTEMKAKIDFLRNAKVTVTPAS